MPVTFSSIAATALRPNYCDRCSTDCLVKHHFNATFAGARDTKMELESLFGWHLTQPPGRIEAFQNSFSRDCLESSRTGRTARLSVWHKASKRASLTPSRRLVRPQNGACSEFPDSLSTPLGE